MAGDLVVRTAIALTLFFVIVFPGLAVVGLAALRLALLACAKNTKAVRPQPGLQALLCAGSLAPGPHTALQPLQALGLGRRWQQMAVEICQHPRGPLLRAQGCVCN